MNLIADIIIIMTVFILDPCNYTKCALKSSLSSSGIKGAIRDVDNVNSLRLKCQKTNPSIIFINQNCFQYQDDGVNLKSIIDEQPLTLFFIFIGNENIKFHDFVPIRDNVVILSKFTKISTMLMIIRYFMDTKAWKKENSPIGFPPLRFSKTEVEILTMWMSGYDTMYICTHLRIKEKTLSSHKINIKRKTKASNKQVIYHLISIANRVTDNLNIHYPVC
ncbi:transcriptional regulator RcsA [Acerihabitans arboris]|uniref:Transcriptional regulator RcsA n=1 Tax=Acerihabitans arboris TaxID=2691583 RepID=A0A845SME3_9GAMM|nr:transcriptional regulator RcsA [Acerihabitans arboris]NDL65169.1 transcriptional regulator RcsA [Acerihabitans arboris]